MRRLWTFFIEMDARAWRAALVSVALLVAVAAVLVIGKTQLAADAEREFETWLQGFAESPWAVLAVIAAFTAAAFVGAPQFLLIAGCVVVFGPWLGFLYSWAATVVSAAVTYAPGRFAGARALERFGGSTIRRLSRFVGRNAFYGSFIIRNVPSAPFIVVNMTFGAARAPFWAFLAGCAVGVLPKTALVAIFGRSVMELTRQGDWRVAALIAVIGFAWLGLMLAARKVLRRRVEETPG